MPHPPLFAKYVRQFRRVQPNTQDTNAKASIQKKNCMYTNYTHRLKSQNAADTPKPVANALDNTRLRALPEESISFDLNASPACTSGHCPLTVAEWGALVQPANLHSQSQPFLLSYFKDKHLVQNCPKIWETFFSSGGPIISTCYS